MPLDQLAHLLQHLAIDLLAGNVALESGIVNYIAWLIANVGDLDGLVELVNYQTFEKR